MLNSFRALIGLDMFSWYIHAGLYKATYEIIDNLDPFFGEILDLKGVWVSGEAQAEDQEYCSERGSERSVISFQDPSPY